MIPGMRGTLVDPMVCEGRTSHADKTYMGSFTGLREGSRGREGREGKEKVRKMEDIKREKQVLPAFSEEQW